MRLSSFSFWDILDGFAVTVEMQCPRLFGVYDPFIFVVIVSSLFPQEG